MKPGNCQWVAVSERLPEKMPDQEFSRNVWVIDGGIPSGDCAAFVRDDVWCGARNPTHWLEVNPPEVPKVKVKKEGWVRPQEIHSEGIFCHRSDCIKVTYEVEE